MSIKRIMLLTSMALVAVAFATPATAQAVVQLTDPDGTVLKKGAKVTARGENLLTTTELGPIECGLVTLHLEVVKNGTTHVELKQLGEIKATSCAFNLHAGGVGTIPLTFTDFTIGVGEEGKLTINTWGTGATSATFVSDTYGDAAHTNLLRSCHVHSKLHFQATPSSPTDLFAVEPSALTVTGEGCPASGILHAQLTLETSTGGTAVKVDYVKTE